MKTIIIVLLALILINSALAEDFNAVGPQEITSYRCTRASTTIDVTNTGNVTSTYGITTSGNPAEWTVANPSKFTLEPTQTQELLLTLNVPCNAKSSSIITTIKTVSGIQKSIKQELAVYLPQNIQLFGNISTTVSPCKDAQYKITLTNPYNFTEEYKITSDAVVAPEKVVLKPSQSVNITLIDKNTDCTISGIKSAPVTIKTLNSDITANFELSTNIQNNGIPQITAPSKITNEYTNATEKIIIKNTGIPTTYNITFQSPNWIKINQTKLYVETEDVLDLEIMPSNISPANYETILTLTTPEGAKYTKTIYVNLRNKQFYTKYPWTTAGIVLGSLLLIGLIAFIIIKIKNRKVSRRVVAKKKSHINYKKWISSILLILLLAGAGILSYVYRSSLAAHKTYIYYGLGALGALIILSLIIYGIYKLYKNHKKGFLKTLKVTGISIIVLATLSAGAYLGYKYRTILAAYWQYIAVAVVVILAIVIIYLAIKKPRAETFWLGAIALIALIVALAYKYKDILTWKYIAIASAILTLVVLIALIIKSRTKKGAGNVICWKTGLTAVQTKGPLVITVKKDSAKDALQSFNIEIPGENNGKLFIRIKKGAKITLKKHDQGWKELELNHEGKDEKFDYYTATSKELNGKYAIFEDKPVIKTKEVKQPETKEITQELKKVFNEEKPVEVKKEEPKEIKKDSKKEATKEVKPKRRMSRLPLFILLLLAIGCIIYAGWPQTTDSNIKGIPDQKWEQNARHYLNITKYFKDPDAQTLTYTVSETKYISTEIRDGVAIFIPEKDWQGQEVVTFTATDAEGASAESNKVALIIEKPIISAKIKTAILYTSTLLALIIFLILILMTFRRP